MRLFRNGVKVLLVLAGVIMSVRITLADEKPLSPSEAIKLMGGLKLITLHLKNATPQQFYNEVWRQMDLPPLDPNPFPSSGIQHAITIDVDKKPFWEVMRKVERENKSPSMYNPYSHGLWFSPFPSNLAGMVDIENPFCFVIYGATANMRHSLNFSSESKAPSVDNQLSLSLRALGDPQIPWLRSGSKLVVTKAVNDKGESMLISKSSGNPNLYKGDYSRPAQFYNFGAINLTPQATPGGRIAHLEGYVDARFAAKSDTLKINNLANARNIEHGAVPKQIDSNTPLDKISYFAVRNVTHVDNGYSFELKFLRPGTSLEFWEFKDAMTAGLRVVDEHGVDLQGSTDSSKSWFDTNDPLSEKLQGAIYHYTFKRTDNNTPDGPVKLIWKYPLDIRTVEVPFEFENILLP
jgi:hypothetical protein